MFKQYLPRAVSMNHETGLIDFFFIGAILTGSVCVVLGGVVLYYYWKRKHMGQVIYLPLGLFFINHGIIKYLEAFSVWWNYAWLTTITNVTSGLLAIWIIWLLPKAIHQRRELLDAYDLRMENMDLERKMKKLKEMYEEHLSEEKK